MDQDEKLDLILDRLDMMDTKLDAMDARFDMIDTRMDALDARFDMVDNRLDAVDTKLDATDAMDARFDAVDAGMESINARFGAMEDEFQKFDELEHSVRDIKLTLENETNKNIVRMAESHLDLGRKLDDTLKVENETEMLAIRINILENELRRVKEKLEQIT